jgi:O-antigen/teichoic acid export membrane protein
VLKPQSVRALEKRQCAALASARQLFKNFVTLFAGNVIGQLLYFLGTLYLAKVFGPAGYGVWSFAQAWQLYLLRIGEFGLEMVGIREIARHPGKTATWTATVVISRICIALVLYVVTIVIVAVNLIPLDAGNLVLLFSVSVFPLALLLEWVYEAKQNVILTSVARILKGVLFAGGVLFFVKGISDITTSVLIYVLSVTIPGVMIFFYVTKSFGFEISSFSIQRGVEAIRKASPIGVATILSHYSLFMGTMTVGYILSKTDLGLFSAAHRVVVLPWAYVFASFQRVLLPTLSRWYHDSLKQYSDFVEKFFRLTILGSIAIGIVGTFFGPALMSGLYPSAYDNSMGVFTILLWALVVAGMRFIFEIALIASDNQRRYLNGMVLLAAVYTIATPLLSWRFGIEGTAWASVIAEFSYFLYLAITFPHMELRAVVNHLWRPMLGGLGAIIIGFSIGPRHHSLQGFLSLGVYLSFIFGSKAFSKGDVRLLFGLVRKQGLGE